MKQLHRRVVVTGLGILSPIGNTVGYSYKKGYEIRESARKALIAASISITDQSSISRSLSVEKIKREYNEQYAQ